MVTAHTHKVVVESDSGPKLMKLPPTGVLLVVELGANLWHSTLTASQRLAGKALCLPCRGSYQVAHLDLHTSTHGRRRREGAREGAWEREKDARGEARDDEDRCSR